MPHFTGLLATAAAATAADAAGNTNIKFPNCPSSCKHGNYTKEDGDWFTKGG